MKSQKAAGHSQNKENEGLLCYKHEHKWLSFPALEIDKSFLILIKAKYFLLYDKSFIDQACSFKMAEY